MVKDLEKFHLPGDLIPPKSLSPEEIFQLLKDHPRGLIHQTKKKEREFYEVFFDFFIDYFYMKENIGLKDFINSLERAILVKMLDRFNGNQKETAFFLGVNHSTLNQKVRKHKINFFKRPIEG
jgi:DNA-binding NtrC family response regulator